MIINNLIIKKQGKMEKNYSKIADEILESIERKQDERKEIDYEKMYKTGDHIILQWKFMGVDVLILFYGKMWHPCAYFRIPDENGTLKRLVLMEWYDAVPFQCVNWWFTFWQEIEKTNDQRLKMWFTPWVWLGWDYGHCDDFVSYYKEQWITGLMENKKRTTSEILKQIIQQIYTLIDKGIL